MKNDCSFYLTCSNNGSCVHYLGCDQDERTYEDAPGCRPVLLARDSCPEDADVAVHQLREESDPQMKMVYIVACGYPHAANYALDNRIAKWMHLHTHNMYRVLGMKEPDVVLLSCGRLSGEDRSTLQARSSKITYVDTH